MKLLTAGPSPFANKVLMAAKLIGLPLEAVNTDAHGQAAELIDANPLGKIPCLVLDDGRTLFDSRPITQYLDRVNGGGLYPSDADALFDVSRYEALCDGICDCAVAFQYEMRMRPEEKWHQPWLDRQWTKVKQGLSEATKELPALDSPLDIRAIGHFMAQLMMGSMLKSARVGLVANRVKENTIIFQNLERFLKTLDIPLVTHLRDSQNYIRSAEGGFGVFEMSPYQVDKDIDQWRPLIEWIEQK